MKVECMECHKLFVLKSHTGKCPRCGSTDLDLPEVNHAPAA